MSTLLHNMGETVKSGWGSVCTKTHSGWKAVCDKTSSGWDSTCTNVKDGSSRAWTVISDQVDNSLRKKSVGFSPKLNDMFANACKIVGYLGYIYPIGIGMGIVRFACCVTHFNNADKSSFKKTLSVIGEVAPSVARSILEILCFKVTLVVADLIMTHEARGGIIKKFKENENKFVAFGMCTEIKSLKGQLYNISKLAGYVLPSIIPGAGIVIGVLRIAHLAWNYNSPQMTLTNKVSILARGILEIFGYTFVLALLDIILTDKISGFMKRFGNTEDNKPGDPPPVEPEEKKIETVTLETSIVPVDFTKLKRGENEPSSVTPREVIIKSIPGEKCYGLQSSIAF